MIEFDEQGHIYRQGGIIYPSVTQILMANGCYGDAVKFFTDLGRERGSYVHLLVKYHLGGCLDYDEIDPVLLPYFNAWLKFEKDVGYASFSCEVPLVDEIHGFAGTPDLIGNVFSQDAVLDLKSGALLPATGLQLAGYEILHGKPLKRYGLQLQNTGNYKLTPFQDRQDRGVFLSALTMYRWKKNNVKGA
jgi:hypothetical protein